MIGPRNAAIRRHFNQWQLFQKELHRLEAIKHSLLCQIHKVESQMNEEQATVHRLQVELFEEQQSTPEAQSEVIVDRKRNEALNELLALTGTASTAELLASLEGSLEEYRSKPNEDIPF